MESKRWCMKFGRGANRKRRTFWNKSLPLVLGDVWWIVPAERHQMKVHDTNKDGTVEMVVTVMVAVDSLWGRRGQAGGRWRPRDTRCSARHNEGRLFSDKKGTRHLIWVYRNRRVVFSNTTEFQTLINSTVGTQRRIASSRLS